MTVTIDAGDLPGLARSWDEAADATDGADPFCSASVWSFAAAVSFTDVEPPVVVGDGEGAWYGCRRVRGDVDLLVGLDPVWGFATPVVGPAAPAAHLVAGRLRQPDWELAVLTGQARGLPLTEALISVLGASHGLHVGPEEGRARADLDGGSAAWFSRRSARFRQRLRRIEREAADTGVEVVDASSLDAAEVLGRVLAVEGRSWKGEEGTGLSDPGLAAFYRRMLDVLSPAGSTRALFARRDGVDLGYVLGGVRGSTYRGFQLSQAREAEAMSVGHLLQLAQVRRAAEEGLRTYDLGMAMPYKERWADRVDTTFALVVRR